MHKLRDLTGEKFNRLTVIQLNGYDDSYRSRWLCKCDCGKDKVIRFDHLLSNKTGSCGCLRSDGARSRSIKKTGFFGDFNELYSAYRRRAIKIKKDFNLSREEFYLITQKDCYYCNTKPSNTFNSSHIKDSGNNYPIIYNGIDRLDNSKGYTLDNCVPCCKVCNYAKHTMNKGEFLVWLQKVYKNLKDRLII